MSTNQSNVNKSHLRIRALCEGAILLALSIVLNYLSKVIFANMPNGGSVSLAMFPILFYAHRWGLGQGLLIGFAYGLLDMLLDGGYAWGWQSILLDYLAAYTALGLGGVFKSKAWGIFPGIACGCLGRFLVHYISGVTIYKILVPTEVEGFGVFANPHVYSLVYNAAYMVPNMLIAIAIAGVLFVPMKKYFAGNDIRN
ncbi:MAG: energy-coupled thiamine transporter ThiT [Oscillospiraceae bacterium]|nr:energy-coupled thiamine transporter ThiT [Oscillospiraceae bacterium]